ncbi:tRNA (adenosine(37)-N6)-threonylcarbamoyltransferase complex ATPase subunit type 1 TsaE [Roseovarius sp. MMSF_3281]|uniref:tRNA (adenosine(37)-N6)-threonylcarbamoyltransferase complex ATPase subunit type 1 TsaE n=1 Tax=Roseovarius sp. MMSF_3281 TaxID=3046694 RepID=UPI00273ED456|nr:tRNA (adenosine(37)-N6)-threonylcarbamoyltransferase complex ATPase subunit type 1 TsaE [Roseovarius sp. MMSF_3281]
MSRQSAQITCHSPDETCAIAQALGPLLRPGDCLLLKGEVGAGKTHFARCLIQGLLEMPEDVPSPTYTLVQTYPGRLGDLWHADLYRLTDIGEVEELGLLEAFETAISLVEWPDRLGDLAPQTALHLTLETAATEDARQLTFEWSDATWDARMKELCNGGS